MTEFSYIVTYDPDSAATVITNDVESLTVTDVGTGEVCSAVMRLNNFNGKYTKTTGTFIDEFTDIRIQITDDSSNTYDRIYEVGNIIPIESSQEGNVIEVELLSYEWHLQNSFFAKQFYFASAYDTIKDIGDQYNDNKASLDPTLEDHDNNTGNKAPKWTANLYDFNIGEKTCYDGVSEVVERIGSTVAAGGAGDFFEMYFQKSSSANTIAMRTFVSGSLPTAGNEITITDTDAVNGNPTEGGIGSTPATIVAAWGADGFGSLPPKTSQFHGILEAFFATSEWVDPASSGQNYPQNARVKVTTAGVPTYYNSDIDDNSSDPTVSDWTAVEPLDDLGTLVYSPWTNGIATSWENSGSNPSGAADGFSEEGMWDGNMVVWDDNHYRTWVDVRATSEGAIPVQLLYLSGTGLYRGLRVLVDGTGTGNFAGFDNDILQYNGTGWSLFRATADGEECAVINEGAVYERSGGTWSDKHLTSRANDCFHGYSSIINNAGVNDTFKDVGHTMTYGDTSAIEVTYKWNAGFFGALAANDANYYSMGCWLNLRFPFPHNRYNSVATLGALWGNNATKKEPVTLDSFNMHLTHSGNTGFNNSEAFEHGPLEALQFTCKLLWTLDNLGGAQNQQGNFKWRVYIYDTSDNVVSADFTITHNDRWQDVSIPLTEFQIYRARIPYRYELDNIAAAFVLNDLDIVNVFEWKNIKQICWQWQESYDEQGRYLPELSRANDQYNLLVGSAHTMSFSVDRVHFSKPLLAVTDPVTTGRAIMGAFEQAPLISNYFQLKQHALSKLEIAKFRHKEFDIRTEGKIDINYGDTFFLQKDDLVSDDDTRTADTGGTANNIRLVAKKIVYKITKTPSESGNFIRFITGIKRFVG